MYKSHNTPGKSTAFTLVSDGGLLSEIITECEVSIPHQPIPGMKHPPLIKARALWDTGATHCAITPEFAKKLNLKTSGKAPVQHADGVTTKDVYRINIILERTFGLSHLPVTELGESDDSFDIIIGMSVITQGDFSITNTGGQTVVSFRMPSEQKIDYCDVPDAKEGDKYPGASRNKPCPCGSKKNYKNCCGKAA